MTLDEAIKHAEEVAEEKEKKAKEYKHNQDNLVRLYHSLDAPYGGDYSKSNEYLEGAEEHRQLAEWLRKLKAYEDAREELERKMNSGQWSDAVRYGMFKALYIQKKHLGEVNADEDSD